MKFYKRDSHSNQYAMSEDLDYMSDEFLKNCVEGAEDVRPGLLKTYNDQRQHDLMKKKNLELEKAKKKPTEVLQTEVLEESLKTPINATNKGFSMLEKMGFRSGMGLGKNSTGIKEPIGIKIKKDKMGLGHEDSEKLIKTRSKGESKLESLNEIDYRTFISNKNRERELLSDLKRSQKVCKELDLKVKKNVADEFWFWPSEKSSDPKDSSNDDGSDDGNNDGYGNGSDDESLELTVEEKLQMLTKYLREKYFYCIWCRVQYSDEKDLGDCPGVTRDDH